MKTLVICWNVSRVAWFRALERATRTHDRRHRFLWVAVGRAEQIRLMMGGIRAPLLPSRAWAWNDQELPPSLRGTDLSALIRYDAALSDAPAQAVLLRRARRYLCWYDDYLARERPDSLLCVNGWRLHTACAVAVARHRNIPVMFVENGYLPYTTVLDPVGVNFAGSLTSMPLSDEVDQRRLNKLVDDYHAGRPPRPPTIPGWREYVARGLAIMASLAPGGNPERCGDDMTLREAFETWRGESQRRGTERDLGEIRPPYVFLPMQVEDDSQLLIHSPWIGNMEQAVRLVLEALPAGVQLVVKRHPSDRGRTPLQGIRQLIERHQGAFIGSGSVRDLIRQAEAVVTINSTVGFEALTWYRPVVVLGQAPYAGRGVTHDVSGPDELRVKLAAALSGAPERALVDRVLYTVLVEYLYPGGWKDPKIDELGPAVAAIIAVGDARFV